MPVMELLQDDEDMVFADDDMLFDLNIEDSGPGLLNLTACAAVAGV